MSPEVAERARAARGWISAAQLPAVVAAGDAPADQTCAGCLWATVGTGRGKVPPLYCDWMAVPTHWGTQRGAWCPRFDLRQDWQPVIQRGRPHERAGRKRLPVPRHEVRQ